MSPHRLAGVAKPTPLKTYPEEAPNTTDIDASLDKLKANDKSLKELNLNNIKVHVHLIPLI